MSNRINEKAIRPFRGDEDEVLIEFKNSVQNSPQILSEVLKLDTWRINDCITLLFEYFVKSLSRFSL